MKKTVKEFLKNEAGTALIEFFIVFPFLILLFFGGIEIARYIVIIQKVDNAAYAVTDAVAQLTTPRATSVAGEATAARVTDAMNLADSIMWPFNNPTKEAVIVSSVYLESHGRVLRWQRSIPGSLGITSVVTGGGPVNTLHRGPSPCSSAPLSEFSSAASGMIFDENMIVGEVYYAYSPVWQTLMNGVASAMPTTGDTFALSPQTIRRVIFMHARKGQLIDLGNPPSQPVTSPEGSECS